MFGGEFNFVNPELLWLLAVIPLLIFGRKYFKFKERASLKISNIYSATKDYSHGKKIYQLPYWLELITLTLFIIALSRPVIVSVDMKSRSNQGIDIVMAIDISASMLAKDLKPNRLDALKRVAEQFIIKRVSDRIGIVVYSGESFTKTPLTTDKGILVKAIRDISYSSVINGGTAIGMGLATSVNRIKSSKAKSKVIILLTDGENNTGIIDPITATELAVEYGIKVYTIGVGTNGMANSPVAIRPNGSFVYQPMPVKIDEKLLKQIAIKTNGKYFRASNNKALKSIYSEIDKLEKTDIEDIKYYSQDELYRIFLIIGLILLCGSLIVRQTLFRSFI